MLHVNPSNRVAMEMYERRGYEKFGQRRWWNGDVLYRKELQPITKKMLLWKEEEEQNEVEKEEGREMVDAVSELKAEITMLEEELELNVNFNSTDGSSSGGGEEE